MSVRLPLAALHVPDRAPRTVAGRVQTHTACAPEKSTAARSSRHSERRGERRRGAENWDVCGGGVRGTGACAGTVCGERDAGEAGCAEMERGTGEEFALVPAPVPRRHTPLTSPYTVPSLVPGLRTPPPHSFPISALLAISIYFTPLGTLIVTPYLANARLTAFAFPRNAFPSATAFGSASFTSLY